MSLIKITPQDGTGFFIKVLFGDVAPVVAGGGNDGHFVFTQQTPLAVWTVPHNLGKRPAVVVVDGFGNEVLADVRYIDSNIVQITHSVPLTGAVYCN